MSRPIYDAITLRGVIASQFKYVGSDDFSLMWNDLDISVREKWIECAGILNDIHLIKNKPVNSPSINKEPKPPGNS